MAPVGEAIAPAPFEAKPDVCPQLGDVIVALDSEFPLYSLFYELLDTKASILFIFASSVPCAWQALHHRVSQMPG